MRASVSAAGTASAPLLSGPPRRTEPFRSRDSHMGAMVPLAGWSHSTPLLAGDAGTEQTVALIREAVHQAWRDPLVRATAGRLIAGLHPQDTEGQARAIFDWVRSHIRFVRDPVDHETVSSARWTLTHGFGDCDDINAVLLPGLLGAVGIPARLVTVAVDPRDPQQFTHVYAEADLGGRWVPVDAARPNAVFGRAASSSYRKRVWEITTSSYQDLAGLSGMGRGLGFALDDLFKVIAQGTQSAIQIIGAARVPRERLSLPGITRPPSYYETAAGGGRYYETGRGNGGPGIPSILAGVEPNTLLLLLGGGLLLVLVMRK